ncbi:hypothetical protein HPB52_024855 [Rhipicephalus sanguineus]|uniref:Uncharacterized protein n=1 Tax=Rhipicephalus sanguineus TaxID=34632 RepID=A0A9D4YRN9_RHISA|nr:hypothetical protein HPB52_024855 [Rhipicephalus sanguineus]
MAVIRGIPRFITGGEVGNGCPLIVFSKDLLSATAIAVYTSPPPMSTAARVREAEGSPLLPQHAQLPWVNKTLRNHRLSLEYPAMTKPEHVALEERRPMAEKINA